MAVPAYPLLLLVSRKLFPALFVSCDFAGFVSVDRQLQGLAEESSNSCFLATSCRLSPKAEFKSLMEASYAARKKGQEMYAGAASMTAPVPTSINRWAC